MGRYDPSLLWPISGCQMELRKMKHSTFCDSLVLDTLRSPECHALSNMHMRWSKEMSSSQQLHQSISPNGVKWSLERSEPEVSMQEMRRLGFPLGSRSTAQYARQSPDASSD